MTDLQKAAKEIELSTSINVVLHVNADGDAVGSALALKEGLKNCSIISADPVATVFESICGKIDYQMSLPSNSDLVILPDTSELHRTGFAGILSKKNGARKILVIDHHTTGDLNKVATQSLHSPTAASTTEIIYDLFCEMRLEITPKIATYLLLGLYTDTGGFQHHNTTSKALKLAGRLVNCGGNLHLITQTLTNNQSTDQKKLWGHILDKVTINRFGFASVKITEAELKMLGVDKSCLSGLANKLALIKEARAVCLAVEEGNSWRYVLRTRYPGIDLRKLAKIFGGTGTRKAAGFTVTKAIFSSKITK